MNRILQNRKGQAFAEAVFIFPVMVLIIFFIIWTARILITWQQLVSATRYGTDMIAYTSLSAEDISKDIKNYLSHEKIEGRKLNPDKIKEIKVDIKQYPAAAVNVSNIYSMIENIGVFAKGIAVPSGELSSVSITYEYDLPLFLNFTGMKKFDITTKSYILAGSGCSAKIHRK